MIEIVVTVKGGRSSADEPVKPSLRTAINTLGVRFIPNADTVMLGANRIPLRAARHNYALRELAQIIHRKYRVKTTIENLSKTLRQMRRERLGV